TTRSVVEGALWTIEEGVPCCDSVTARLKSVIIEKSFYKGRECG
ncbi:glutathione S-transferase, partial [Centipeda periodontii DSM 2778]